MDLNAQGNEASADVDRGQADPVLTRQPPRETQGPRAVSVTVSPGVTPRPALPVTVRFACPRHSTSHAAEDSQSLPSVPWWDGGCSSQR